jgi:hypothetical protein
VLDPDRVRLHRVRDRHRGERERPAPHRLVRVPVGEREHSAQPRLLGHVRGAGDPVDRAVRSKDRQRAQRSARAVGAEHMERQQVDAVVDVQVRQSDGVDVLEPHIPLQSAQAPLPMSSTRVKSRPSCGAWTR